MNPPQPAHRPEFTVRCACGIAYHTSDEHVGKKLPCRCGRTVDVVRPAEHKPPITSTSSAKRGSRSNELFAAEASTSHSGSRRRKRSHHEGDAAPGFLASFSKYREERKARRSSSAHRSSGGASTSSSARRRRTPNGMFGRVWQPISIWLASTLRPLFFGAPFNRAVAALAWGYLAAVTLSWFMLVFTSERVLPGTIIAYGPRFLSLYPLLLLAPLSALFARATLWPLLLGSWVAFVPLMGARFSPTTLFAAHNAGPPAPGTLRILTFNAEGGARLAFDLPIMLREQQPDIVTFQECGDRLWDALEGMKGWYSRHYSNLCTASRWPIADMEMMPRADLARIHELGFGGTGLVMRSSIDTPRGPLVLINLHLETARKGLEGMLSNGAAALDDPLNVAVDKRDEAVQPEPSQFQRFEINALIRNAESQRASRYASQNITRAPIIVAGDFNLPVESTIFQDHWRAFTDAFEAKGNGLGWSKREGRWLRIRIDHVLTNDAGPKPVHVEIGPDYSSDHLPVIVDLAWPRTMAERGKP